MSPADSNHKPQALRVAPTKRQDEGEQKKMKTENQTDTTAGLKEVRITFHDGETITEHSVDEVHDREDSLFLRRYGLPGLEFDKCDIKSFSVKKP